jgi:hypothetical protein
VRHVDPQREMGVGTRSAFTAAPRDRLANALLRHNAAMDPNRNLAYSSYYAGGMRVFSFGESGIQEVGHYIDSGGNNFWGTETFVATNSQAGNLQGKRLFAGSDRDYGIFIFRYTGR